MSKPHFFASLFKSVIILSSGTSIAQIILVLNAPILTRLYSPDQFGVLAVYMSSVTILGAFSTFRFELVLPLPRHDELAINALALALFCVLVISLVSAVALPLSSDTLAGWLNIPALPDISWLVPFGVLSIGTYTVLSNWAVRHRRFSVIARTKLTQAITQAAIQTGAAFSPFATLGLLIGSLLGQSAGISSFSREITKRDRMLLRRITLKRIWFLARHYWRFPAFSLPASVAFSAGQQLPSLVLFSMFGPASAGFFLLARRVGMMPATMIGTSISQSMFRHLAINKKNRLEVGRVAERPVKLMATLMIAPAALCAFVVPLVTGAIFGQAWVQAGYYLSWMAPWIAASIVFGAMTPIVSVLNLQKMGLVFQVLSLAASLAGMYFAGLEWGPVAAVAGYSVTKSASMLIYRLHMFHLVGLSPWPIAANIGIQTAVFVGLFGGARLLFQGDAPIPTGQFGASVFLLLVGLGLYGALAVRGIRQATQDLTPVPGGAESALSYEAVEAE